MRNVSVTSIGVRKRKEMDEKISYEEEFEHVGKERQMEIISDK